MVGVPLTTNGFGEGAVRQRIFSGEVVWRPASLESGAVVACAWQALVDGLGTDAPRDAFGEADNDAFFERFTAVRRAFPQAAGARAAVARWLVAGGWSPATTFVDGPRLRALTPWGHRIPAAAAAYAPHRDTWFANPAAQVNVWLAVHDTAASEVVAWYPHHFACPVPNTSSGFDLDAWSASGGFQAESGAPQHHPAPQPGVKLGVPVQRAMAAGESLIFSAAQLHGTLPSRDAQIRYSVEVRVVDRSDVARGLGAILVDSAARGDTSAAMWALDEAQATAVRP